MLLFKPCHKPLILAGAKTQTRRVWPKSKNSRCRVGSTHQARTELFGEPFATLRILRVWQEPLGDISDSDAKAEGYPNKDTYLKAFESINGTTALSTVVWCIEFRLETKVE